MTTYRLYWQDRDGRNREQEFDTLTEATIRKAELRRAGIAARIVPIRTPADWDDTVEAYLRLVGG